MTSLNWYEAYYRGKLLAQTCKATDREGLVAVEQEVKLHHGEGIKFRIVRGNEDEPPVH